MALIDLKIFSESLGMQTSVLIVMPQKNTLGQIGIESGVNSEKYKCLYLLHGLSDDQTIWMRNTSIERYATERGICVVMPMGAKSFYSDMKYGSNYYTYIAKELPEIIENMFNVSEKREDRYIGGLSMGGYGAMKIALKEEDRYTAAFGLSPVSDIHNEEFKNVLLPVFGGTISDEEDLFFLASKHNTDEVKPRIYMTIGTEDFMYKDAVRLSQHFDTLNYNYKYIETPGSHTWSLWDATVQSALDWILR